MDSTKTAVATEAEENVIEQRSKRSLAAKRSHDRRRAELMAAIKDWEPEVPILPIAEIRAEAIKSYNGRYRYKRASAGDSKKFLDRITVNFIRHKLTGYDGLRKTLHGRTGKQQAIEASRDKTLIRIATLYPDLLAASASQCTSPEAFAAVTGLASGHNSSAGTPTMAHRSGKHRRRRRRRARREPPSPDVSGAISS